MTIIKDPPLELGPLKGMNSSPELNFEGGRYNNQQTTELVTTSYIVECINDPVVISLPEELEVIIGKRETFTFTASDVDSSNFSLSVMASNDENVLPLENISLVQTSEISNKLLIEDNGRVIESTGEFRAKWKLNIKPLPDIVGHSIIMIKALDSEGLSKNYTIKVNIKKPKKVVFIHTDYLGSPVAQSKIK
ncbi:hypothetical protein [Pseudoalteromonas piscicida]|uniref:Uncharacterized protein n=1 Tax=Pseudoalteromonas piscicida TaxID=43662 RepID=A0A2A5JJN4_PSEO7|nr:hypothetical protein [Pseudoalteromonas piscicida]PCK29653.1 hypothetical protein CEX98_21475 [Pseudoalteromonas piscicida]